jgi:hypothetical protein
MHSSRTEIVAVTAVAFILTGFLVPAIMGGGSLAKANALPSADKDNSMNIAYAHFKATTISSASERGESSPYLLTSQETRMLAGEKMSHNIVFVGAKQFPAGSDTQVVFVSSNPEKRYVVSETTAQRVNYEAFHKLISSGNEITTNALGDARKSLLESKYQNGIPEPLQVDIHPLYEKFKTQEAAQLEK